MTPARRKYYLKCVFVILGCAGVFAVELGVHPFFGEIVNAVFPCEQNPMNSAPCSLGYDLYLGVALLAAAGVAFCLLLYALMRDFVFRKRAEPEA